MTDKRMTEEEVVAELRDGMTIGIGGWGSRRKPMSIVRAIANSDLKDLTVASYAGPDLGLLCATGKVKKAIYPFCSLDSIALEPHFRNARQNGSVQTLTRDPAPVSRGTRSARRLPAEAEHHSTCTNCHDGSVKPLGTPRAVVADEMVTRST